ncbi:MAG: metallophosphoesterase [Polyangiaceae bacterium]|nr:metallophosphoesterase [Polyangiaceae bacterium]
MDTLDQIHVVSDLHLGGVPGHQIFNQGRALAAVIDHLAREAARGQRVGLVLNGDIVDFLAAEDAAYFDPKGAARKLRDVFEDEAFRPVWDALSRFAATERAVLALVLGNHDVELALPPITELLCARICGPDEAARTRVRVAMDEKGFTALVGGRRVLCAHGNQVDPWNPVDFAALRRVVRALEANEDLPEWEPNAGTRLVVDLMNEVKNDYAFVDLLKPETVPVGAVLLALGAQSEALLGKVAKVMMRKYYDQGRLATGMLSGKPVEELTEARAIELLLRPETWRAGAQAARPARAWSGEDWLRQATEDDRAGRRPVDLVDASAGGTLGFGGLILDRMRGRDPRENLRDALARYLEKDRSFQLDEEDEAFTEMDALGGDADVVIAGHTHLARQIKRKRAPGVYFNSGTWIRLIQLTPDMLAPERFAAVYDALRAGTLEVLDAVPGLVVQRRTVVSVWADGDTVYGELRAALEAPAEGAAPEDPPWRPEPGAEPHVLHGAGRSARRAPAKEEASS